MIKYGIKKQESHTAPGKEKTDSNKAFEEYLGKIAERVGKKSPQFRKRTRYIGMAALAAIGFTISANVAKAGDEGIHKPAIGMEITKADQTEEVLAIVKMNQVPKGTSYNSNGNQVQNGFTLQLNLHAEIDKGGGRENNHFLWLQFAKIYEERTGEWVTGSIDNIWKFGKEETEVHKSAHGDTLVTYRPLENLSRNQIVGDHGASAILTLAGNTNFSYYASSDVKPKFAKFPTQTALDIKIKNIDASTVNIYFNNIPVNNGILEWNKETTFDTVKYKGGGHVSIVFGKDNGAAIVTAGEGAGRFFVAKRFDAELSMYSVSEGRVLTPLETGGFTDPTTTEGITGVHVRQLSTNSVEVISSSRN